MNKIVIFVGASGTGKSRLMHTLSQEHNAPVLCSYTTRSPRPGEKDGKDYCFVSRAEMDGLELFERIEYAGNVYGTPKAMFDKALAENKVSLIAMNIDGANKLKNAYGESVSLVLLTMPQDVRRGLLERRDGAEAAAKRLATEDAPARSSDADFDMVLPNNGSQWKQIHDFVEAIYFD